MTRTITTDATARREAVPDLATVNVRVLGEGDTAAVAHAAVCDRAETLRESVTSVSADQLQTTDRRVEKTSNLFESETDAPYQATECIRVECAPETAEAVVLDMTDAGGSVTSVEFDLHGEVARELQNGALTAATTRAREKAEGIATAEGLAVGAVQSATTEEMHGGMEGMEGLVEDSLTLNSDVTLQPTPTAVAVTVEVVYELVKE